SCASCFVSVFCWVSGLDTVLLHVCSPDMSSSGLGNVLDDVATEMTQLSLTGMSTRVGQVSITLNSASPTLGMIEENSNNTPGTLDRTRVEEGKSGDKGSRRSNDTSNTGVMERSAA